MRRFGLEWQPGWFVLCQRCVGLLIASGDPPGIQIFQEETDAERRKILKKQQNKTKQRVRCCFCWRLLCGIYFSSAQSVPPQMECFPNPLDLFYASRRQGVKTEKTTTSPITRWLDGGYVCHFQNAPMRFLHYRRLLPSGSEVFLQRNVVFQSYLLIWRCRAAKNSDYTIGWVGGHSCE